MTKRKVSSVPIPVRPDPKTDVKVLPVRDADGRPVKLGTIVKREKTPHELYGYLPKIHGRVVRIYTLPEKERILVDVIDKKGNVRPLYLDTLHRSASKTVPKEKIV